jgi:hypothetical protein
MDFRALLYLHSRLKTFSTYLLTFNYYAQHHFPIQDMYFSFIKDLHNLYTSFFSPFSAHTKKILSNKWWHALRNTIPFFWTVTNMDESTWLKW